MKYFVLSIALVFAFIPSGCVTQSQTSSSNTATQANNAATSVVTPTPENLKPDTELQSEIAEIAKEAKGKVGVYAVEIETGKSAALDENGHYAMQSVVKVPISMAVMKMVGEGKLKLDQLVNVYDADMASTNQRSPIRDRTPQGTQLTVEELIKDALVESDGTASDVLQRIAGGASAIQAYVDSIGISDMKIVWSHKEFSLEWSRQYENWLTPKSSVALMKALLNQRNCPKGAECKELLLLSFMKASKNPDDRILGMLPKGTVVAHKTGTGGTQNGITSVTNDVGIITMPNGNHVAIAVLVGDSSGTPKERAHTIAKIAKAVFEKWSGVKPQPVKGANFNERHTLN